MKPMRQIVLACVLVLLAADLARAIQTVAFVPGATLAAQQSAVLDVIFTGPANLRSPFEVKADALFVGPGGAHMKVPLFFDGGREFMLRFAPPSAGEWKFRTSSPVKELDGLAGTVAAAPRAANRHGAVMVCRTSPQHFAYADGTPYFPIAFECDWLFALDGNNPGSISKTRTLVNYVASHGFNQIVMNVYAYDVRWAKDPKLKAEFDYSRPKYCPFGGNNEHPDFSTLNIAFFRHLDRVLSELDGKGIEAHLMIYVWNKKVNWPAPGSPADNRYFDYVVKRYQGFPNLIWDISKEALSYGHNGPGYITDRIRRLRALDAFHRLVTVHDYGYCAKFPGQVDFISIQTWKTDLYAELRKVVQDHPDKPVLNIENGAYEAGPYHVFTGKWNSPDVCLERAYECVFAGAFPTYYWQDTSWSVVIPNPAILPPGEQPKMDYYRHLADWVRRYDVVKLKPAGMTMGNSPCLTDGKRQFLFFVPKENNSIEVKLPPSSDSRMKVVWINPRTGGNRNLGVMKFQSIKSFATPGRGGFSVLAIELLSGSDK